MIGVLGRFAAAARAAGLGSALRAMREGLDRVFLALGRPPLRTTVDGVVVRGFLRHRSFLAHLRRSYEPYLRSLFTAAVADADVVVDAGAHVGFYSLLAARLQPGACIVAIEPDPYNVAGLVANVHQTSVQVVPKAAADEEGLATFQQNLGTVGSSLIERPGTGPVRVVEVETTRIDAVAPPARSLVLKLDVEGAERRALAGAERTIAGAERAVLFVELNPKALAAGGESGAALVQALEALGLDVRFVDEERGQLVPATDLSRKGNLVATKG